ncbi:MAG TPA: nucleoside monophosphate kinase [Candidatus Acidoferrum sp.]|nr:nucleoside monophosphate kinase [Candidatus Acidoferrum sp.]
MHDNEEPASSVRVERVRLCGPGAVILTGPSSCGKGEVAAALCRVLSIARHAHLSMGEILRAAVSRARSEAAYARRLAEEHQVSDETSIFDCVDASAELTHKVRSHAPALEAYFRRPGMAERTSQLEWLEFCTRHGLLVPNRWTQEFVAAHLETSEELRADPFILDGYPRTVAAAEHLLALLRRLDIPIIKVLHLSISKQEMLSRARLRRRADDDDASLRSRYEFYVDKVQPSVDYLKVELGSQSVALIDAHQPVYCEIAGEKRFELGPSIANVAVSALRALGVPGAVARDLAEQIGRRDE